MHYILNGHELVPADLFLWAMWYESADRRVRYDEVGDVRVSTIFLGIRDAIFETKVFGGPHDEYVAHSDTWDEAEKAHELALWFVREDAGR